MAESSSLWSQIYHFGEAIWPHKQILLTGISGSGISHLLEWYRKKKRYWKSFDKPAIHAFVKKLPALFLWVTILFVSFQVYDDEYLSNVELHEKLHVALQTNPDVLALNQKISEQQSDINKLRENYWSPLTPNQVSLIESAFKNIEPRPISIECASLECRELASNLGDIFARLHWTVKIIHQGSMIGMGLSSVMLLPADETTHNIGQIIEADTGIKVYIPDKEGARKPSDPPDLFLVIGTKPF